MTVDALTVELGELVAGATALPTSIDPVRPPAVPGCFVGPPAVSPDPDTNGRLVLAQWEIGAVVPATTGAWSQVATHAEHIAAAIVAHAVLGFVSATSVLYTTDAGELPGYRIDVAVLLHAHALEPMDAGVHLIAVATLTATGIVLPVGMNDGAAALVAVAALTAAGAVVGIPINDGAATLTAVATLTAAGTVLTVPTIDGAATLTAVAAMTATGTVVSAAWTPAALPGIVGWYAADDPATITATAGRVSAWANKAGAAGPLAQSVGSSQPVSGANTINGRNTIDFSVPRTARFLAAAAGVTASPTYRYWAFVTTITVTSVGLSVFSYGDASFNQLAASPEARTQANPDVLSAQVAHHYGTGPDPWTVPGNAFIEIEVDTVAHTLKWWRNHVQQGATNTDVFAFAADYPSPTFCLGVAVGVSGWEGRIGEVFTTDTKPSTTDRSNIDAWVTGRWAL